MGKNLTWLIDEAKQPTRRGEYYYDVWQTIMMNHGEALIAALEDITREVGKLSCPAAYHLEGNDVQLAESLEQCQQLLAQLEVESQP